MRPKKFFKSTKDNDNLRTCANTVRYSVLIGNEDCVIAIVDDEELVRTSLQRLLKMAGYTIAAFTSAEEFLKSGLLQEVRCLIADIRMPGMSGVDLQSQLNAEDYQIPIIFITAHGDEKMRIRAMRDGAVAFLAKPFDNSVLLDRVRTCLNVTQDEE
jgi:FixJ family two-component response regulator